MIFPIWVAGRSHFFFSLSFFKKLISPVFCSPCSPVTGQGAGGQTNMTRDTSCWITRTFLSKHSHSRAKCAFFLSWLWKSTHWTVIVTKHRNKMLPTSHHDNFIGSSIEIMKDVKYALIFKCGNCYCPLRSKCGEKSCFQLINVVIISYFYRALNAQGADNIWSGAKQIKSLVQSRQSPYADRTHTKATTQSKHGTAWGHCKGRAVGGEMALSRREQILLKYNKRIKSLE